MMSDVEIYAVINSSLSNESIPLSLENVEAGFPLPNGGQIDRRLDVNSYLLDHPKATIAFTVSGESMIDAVWPCFSTHSLLRRLSTGVAWLAPMLWRSPSVWPIS